MKLLVVIVHYRTPALAVACLRSVAPEIAAIPGSRVVVVENASCDGSAEQIAAALRSEGWTGWASLLVAERNGGFAYGNNQALRAALASEDPPEFVQLLNPDTLLRPGALRALLEFMERHPDVGIAGSRLEDRDGSVQLSAFRFYCLGGELAGTVGLRLLDRLLATSVVAPPAREEAHPTDWVCGASMMIRRRVFEDAGLFDECYFLYFEEADFCLQARRAGWSCWYVPESRVVHLRSQSTGVGDLSTPMPPYWFRSRRHYHLKNHGGSYLLATNLIWLAGFASWRLRRRLQRKPDTDPPRMMSDFLRLSFRASGDDR